MDRQDTVKRGLLADLPGSLVGEMEAVGHRLTLAKGNTLFLEGDLSNDVFLLQHGNLSATRVSFEGDERIIAIFRPGDLIGEMASLETKERSATVVALSKALLIRWPADVFFAFADREPLIWRYIARTLSQRLRVLNVAFTARHFLPFRGQFAVLLLQLSDDLGVDWQDGSRRINVKLTQADFAEMVGASREYVSRAISEMTQDGILARREGYYHILSQDKLDALSDG